MRPSLQYFFMRAALGIKLASFDIIFRFYYTHNTWEACFTAPFSEIISVLGEVFGPVWFSRAVLTPASPIQTLAPVLSPHRLAGGKAGWKASRRDRTWMLIPVWTAAKSAAVTSS